MALTKIQYTDKETLVNQPDIADKNKCTANDLNEIKSVVNNAIDQVDTNTTDISNKIDNSYGTSQTIGYSQEYVNNALLDTYSTTETIVGKWYNNKPIYRKVIPISQQTLPNNKWLFIDHNIGVDEYITFYGFVVLPGDTIQPIPRLVTDAVANWSIGSGDFTSNRVGIQFGTYYNIINGGYIVLEYTKTTD